MTDADLLSLIRATPALRTYADAGNDAGLAAAVPQYATVTVPQPFTAVDLMRCVSQANRGAVARSAMYYGVQVAVQAQDRTSVANEAQLCVDAGLISAGEQAAINAVLAATTTQPDVSVGHAQVSRVLAPLRADEQGVARATPINW